MNSCGAGLSRHSPKAPPKGGASFILHRRAIRTIKREWQVIRLARRDIVPLKRRAAALAGARSAYYAKRYGVTYTKITIRAQKKRWGSCSARGNLSFNYKIAALPPHLADYIVVHEICHLREMNHSPRFWALVAEALPEYQRLRRELSTIVFSFR